MGMRSCKETDKMRKKREIKKEAGCIFLSETESKGAWLCWEEAVVVYR